MKMYINNESLKFDLTGEYNLTFAPSGGEEIRNQKSGKRIQNL